MFSKFTRNFYRIMEVKDASFEPVARMEIYKSEVNGSMHDDLSFNFQPYLHSF